MVLNGRTMCYAHQDVCALAGSPPHGWNGMTQAQKQKGEEEWKAAHPAPMATPLPEAEVFKLPNGYDDTQDHIANFFPMHGDHA